MTDSLVPSEIRSRIRTLIGQLTLEEKASLTVGRDFWTTQPVERLGIPSIWVTDGPTGVRKSPSSQVPGIGDSVPATCFPTASAIAASWDVELAREVGAAIGREAQAQGVQVILGPGVNLKRSPLAGRNFEYFAEDPVLSGEMAAAVIDGIQSQGVGTSLKHFVANEQETGRMYVDSLVDQRTLREVYLRPFEIAVHRARPWSLMCAYNQLNGEFCAEHRTLLTTILREEWGHEGFVISDWTAVNDRAAGVAAGLDLQMPGADTAGEVVAAVRDGSLDEAQLDAVVEDLLGIVFLADAAIQAGASFDEEKHHALARRAAAESIVLLRNDGHLLPLDPAASVSVALIGEFARTPRFQGGGSSEVIPTRTESLEAALAEALGAASITFAAGYGPDGVADHGLHAAAVAAATQADVAIVVVGLPDAMETEGRDRTHIDLPAAHNALVSAVTAAQPNTVVVLVNGSAVAMPWAGRAPAMLEAWLGGQAAGGAIADILTGVVNPSGRLSETFPVRIEDTPAHLTFPTSGDGTVRFAEGVFTGHRWYDARKIAPRFPFGHGLSYTTFAFDGLTIDADRFAEDGTLEVCVTVENTGNRPGKQVVQLYVGECAPHLPRPLRELKAFAKVSLGPGASKPVTFTLDWRDLAYWDARSGAWALETGEYEFAIGESSACLPLTATVHLESSHAAPVPIDRLTPLKVALDHPVAGPALQPLLQGLRGEFGEGPGFDMMMLFMSDSPLRKFVPMGLFTNAQLDEMIAAANTA